jgi:hypothetical protein
VLIPKDRLLGKTGGQGVPRLQWVMRVAKELPEESDLFEVTCAPGADEQV